MSGGEALLRVRGLSAGYGDGCTVKDVSFSLRAGEILCIVGESGCGKSTLLRALLGSAPGLRIRSGELRLEGVDLLRLPPRQRQRLSARHMGVVFQRPGAAFNPIRSYRAQFIETLKSHGKYRAAAFEREAGEAFEKLGLSDCRRLLAACPYELSGGMNQRVGLALAMLLKQEILLADEPTSALDATIQLQVAEELKRLRDLSGMAMIVVTHNLALARFLGDRIGVMYAGRLAELGRAGDVLSSPLHPYTRCLLAAIPSLDGHMPQGLEGQPPADGPREKGCEFLPRCPRAGAACGEAAYALREAAEGHFVSCALREGGEP